MSLVILETYVKCDFNMEGGWVLVTFSKPSWKVVYRAHSDGQEAGL